jgi:copper chaperone CopZ
VTASLCCILPIVFALTGVTVAGAAAAFGEGRQYLLGVTFGLLGLGFYFAYRRANAQCAPGSACAAANRQSRRVLLWVATIAVVAFAAFPFYSAPVAEILLPSDRAQAVSGHKTAKLRTATFIIEGMDCAGCATTIEKKLKAVAGVESAVVSYANKKAEVRYDSVTTSLEQLQEAIADADDRVFRTLERSFRKWAQTAIEMEKMGRLCADWLRGAHDGDQFRLARSV